MDWTFPLSSDAHIIAMSINREAAREIRIDHVLRARTAHEHVKFSCSNSQLSDPRVASFMIYPVCVV